MLVEKGYRVRASVRDLRDERKTAHLRQLDAELVEADILQPDSLARAMKGVNGVFQVAAVYDLASRNPMKDVHHPIVTGSSNVLRAARDASVEKIVYTSSTTAAGVAADDGVTLNEEDWNHDAVEPYARAKTFAEHEAWRFAKAHDMNLVSILPAAIIGPGFFRHTPTTQSFEQLLRGRIPFALPLSFSFADVRDVAHAHILAYEGANARGRYIASSHYCSLLELFQLAQDSDQTIKAPKLVVPQKLLWSVPMLDWLNHKVTKAPRFATRKFLREYVNKSPRFTSEKLRSELDWKPIKFEDSVSDTVAWSKRVFIDMKRRPAI
jgi:dihydroflavonol-4-reductase